MQNVPQNQFQSGSTDTVVRYASGLSDEQKMNLAIERKKELRTIRKGDYMALKNNPEQAIVYYKNALDTLPNDIVIKRKLAHTYYLIRDWKRAYTYYSGVPIADLKENDRAELFQSLYFDDTRTDRLLELARYDLDTIHFDYYRAVDVCYTGIHNCIVGIESYSGSSPLVVSLKKIIAKSTEISPDYQYRNFLVAAELYQYSMYGATDIITSEILAKRPNYNEVRKLKGFALYELGKYSQARDMLLSYIQENPKDLESIIKLGEIYASLGDYVTSSLYLNNAVNAGYAHKTEVERRLAYNYAAINDTASMLKVLSYLIQEKDVTEDDFAVAISLALYQGENTKAYAWAYTSMEKYQNSVRLIPLYLSAMRINGKFHDTIGYIESLRQEISNNPLVQLEYAIALYESNQSDRALSIFTLMVSSDPLSDWSIEASQYIRLIESAKTNSTSLPPKI